jgi:acyl-[acyl-carrier-protein]-phospholipid O-acyltransferase/long-chain-fatty-acid--[acyl-carrier-protein] ligase
MEMLTITGLLAGMVVASFLATIDHYGILILSTLFMTIASLGWLFSSRIASDKTDVNPDFRQTVSPLKFYRLSFRQSKKYKGTLWAVAGLCAFWFIASMYQLNLLIHLPGVYGTTPFETGLVITLAGIGIGLGCWVSGKLMTRRAECSFVPLGLILMAGSLTLQGVLDTSLIGFSALTFLTAFSGGFMKVPLNTWIQEHIPHKKLGQILAFTNMSIYLAAMLSAIVFESASGLIPSQSILLLLAGVAWISFFIAASHLPDHFLRIILVGISHIVFRLDIRGSHHVPRKSGALVVANHASFLDFLLVVASIPRQVRFVMMKDMYTKPFLNWIFRRFNMIPVNPRGGENDLEEFTRLCVSQLENGHVVCIFAEGTVTRTGQLLEFKKGLEHIAAAAKVPVIPLHFGNLQNTPFTFSVGRKNIVVPGLKSLQRRVFANIGEALAPSTKAFEVRQTIKELESDSFARALETGETIGSSMTKALKRHRYSIKSSEGSIKSRQLLNRAIFFSNKLKSQLQNHQNVAVLLFKSKDSLALQIALQMMGKTVINLQPVSISDDRSYVLKKTGTELIITSHEYEIQFAHRADTVIYLEDISTTTILDSIRAYLSAFWMTPEDFSKKATGGGSETAVIIVENVDVGQPRLIPLSHTNILATVRSMRQIVPHGPNDTFMSDMRWSNAFGYVLEVVYSTLIPNTSLMSTANGVVGDFCNEVKEYAPTVLLAEGKTVDALSGNHGLNSVHSIYTDNIPNDKEMMFWSNRGVQVYTSFGMNETSSVLAVNTPNFNGDDIAGKRMVQQANKQGSVGRPLPGVAVKIVDPRNLNIPLNPGEVGRVLVKGASIAKHVRVSWDAGCRYLNDWLILPVYGHLDVKGFLTIT